MSDLVSERMSNKGKGKINSLEDLDKIYKNIDNDPDCDSSYSLRTWPCDTLRVPCMSKFRIQ